MWTAHAHGGFGGGPRCDASASAKSRRVTRVVALTASRIGGRCSSATLRPVSDHPRQKTWSRPPARRAKPSPLPRPGLTPPAFQEGLPASALEMGRACCSSLPSGRASRRRVRTRKAIGPASASTRPRLDRQGGGSNHSILVGTRLPIGGAARRCDATQDEVAPFPPSRTTD